ncbi:MAG: hypothetical protein LBK13_12930 [Spirochaetales bacterium]|nr:hypothetical protein [Spirochaetales bacterium]
MIDRFLFVMTASLLIELITVKPIKFNLPGNFLFVKLFASDQDGRI